MQRFLVNRQCINHGSILLEGDIVHQIRNVLRLKSGEQIVVFDNNGVEYTATIDKVERNQITGTICDTRRAVEPGIKITLYQALLKSDHFEFVLQKCTEIGVSSFVPVICERCVARKPGAAKNERWTNIIREATEQSGGSILPVLKPAVPFDEACHSAKGLSLIARIGSGPLTLREILRSSAYQNNHSIISLFIGPEGGFNSGELELAQRCNIQEINLGPRVLRAETAGLVAAAAILYEYGELDRPPTDIGL